MAFAKVALFAFAPKFSLGGVFTALVDAHASWVERQKLAALPAEMLEDIGLTRADVFAVTRK